MPASSPFSGKIPNVFELFHLKPLDFEFARDIRFGSAKPLRLSEYEQVADFFSLPQSIQDGVEAGLEYVFAITQNVDRSWVEAVTADDADLDLAVFAPRSASYRFPDKSLRSTSVGDIIRDVRTDTYYLVASVGFTPVELVDVQPSEVA